VEPVLLEKLISTQPVIREARSNTSLRNSCHTTRCLSVSMEIACGVITQMLITRILLTYKLSGFVWLYRFGWYSVRILANTAVMMAEVSRGFPPTPSVNSVVVFRLDFERFFPNPL
jgi:hypothetical protein